MFVLKFNAVSTFNFYLELNLNRIGWRDLSKSSEHENFSADSKQDIWRLIKKKNVSVVIQIKDISSEDISVIS